MSAAPTVYVKTEFAWDDPVAVLNKHVVSMRTCQHKLKNKSTIKWKRKTKNFAKHV